SPRRLDCKFDRALCDNRSLLAARSVDADANARPCRLCSRDRGQASRRLSPSLPIVVRVWLSGIRFCADHILADDRPPAYSVLGLIGCLRLTNENAPEVCPGFLRLDRNQTLVGDVEGV